MDDRVLTKECYDEFQRVTPELINREILYYDGEYAVIYTNGIFHEYILKYHPELIGNKVPIVTIQEICKSVQSIGSAYINIEDVPIVEEVGSDEEIPPSMPNTVNFEHHYLSKDEGRVSFMKALFGVESDEMEETPIVGLPWKNFVVCNHLKDTTPGYNRPDHTIREK